MHPLKQPSLRTRGFVHWLKSALINAEFIKQQSHIDDNWLPGANDIVDKDSQQKKKGLAS